MEIKQICRSSGICISLTGAREHLVFSLEMVLASALAKSSQLERFDHNHSHCSLSPRLDQRKIERIQCPAHRDESLPAQYSVSATAQETASDQHGRYLVPDIFCSAFPPAAPQIVPACCVSLYIILARHISARQHQWVVQWSTLVSIRPKQPAVARWCYHPMVCLFDRHSLAHRLADRQPATVCLLPNRGERVIWAKQLG